MAGRYTGTLPAYSIMSTGPGLPSRLELGTEEYKRRREEELRRERLRQQEELRSRPGYGARGVDPNLLTVTATKRNVMRENPRYSPQPGKSGAPTSVQIPSRQRVLNPEYARSQQFGVGRGGAPVRMPGRHALSDRYQQAGRGGAPGMAESERDPWLTDDDAAFLMSLLDPILNPPAPPTPYGTFGGGGNKAWASLPFLMRGYS